jgi:hypothetical protein
MDKEVSEAEEEADALLASVGMPTIPLPTYNNNENANKEGNNNNGSETVAEEIQDELTTVENEISSLVVAKNKIDTQLTNNVNGDSDGNGDDGEVIAKNIDNTIEDLEMVEEELIVEALEEGADDTISSSGGSDTASSAAAAASAPAGMMNTDDTITSTHSTTMVEDGEESGNGAHLYHTTTSKEGENFTNNDDETTAELKEEIDEIEQEIKVVEAIGIDDDTVMMDDNAEINKEEYVEELKEYEEEVTEELVVKEKVKEDLATDNNNNGTSMIGNTNDDDDSVQKDTQSGMDKNNAKTPSLIPGVNLEDETTEELKEEIDEIENEIKQVETIVMDDDDATEIREEEYVEKLKEYEEEVTEELVVKEKEEALGNNSDNSGTNKTNNNVTPMTGNENDDDGAGLGLTPATEEEEETSTPSPTVEYVEPSESLDPLKDENNIETYENGEVISKSQPMKHGNSNTESHEEKEDELSGETFKNTFPDWGEEEEVKKVGGWLTFAAIVLMIYTAYQMSENPDGICAR